MNPVKLILSHRTGFPNWRFQTPSKKLIFNFEPGTKVGYSGEGYEYLRRALEHKFGRTLQQIADSVLFEPAGMYSTRFSWGPGLDSSIYAVPHANDGTAISRPLHRTIVAADWLVTTIKDYSTFGAHVLNHAGLSQQLFSDMATQQGKLNDSTQQGMGLGWAVINGLPDDEYLLMHTGHDEGVSSFVMLLPNSRRGFVIFTNGDKGANVIVAMIRSMLKMKELEPYLK